MNKLKRRNFIKRNVLAGAGLLIGTEIFGSKTDSIDSSTAFKLKYAPHFGMFSALAGDDHIDQLKFMANQGFTAFEDNNLKGRPVEIQQKIGDFLKKNGMSMGVFVAHKISWKEPNLTSGSAEKRKEFLSEIRDSIKVAKRVGAKWMTVVPGALDQSLAPEVQTINVIESLKAAASILEPHGVVMVLEPLNFRNHPGMFLTESPQAYHICRAVNSPSCKILYDIYHQQIQEGNLIPNIETFWDEIAYFQVGDNPGRNEPGTGEINYRKVFQFIYENEFEGIVGMEHGNSVKGEKGEKLVIKSYQKNDMF